MDGRVLRGERNHELIVQAVYDLVRAGHVEPSVDAVARRAGVGRRTIFRQFHDLESLSRGLAERVQREVFARFQPVVPTGDLEVDLRTMIARRAALFEHIAPFRRAGRAVRHKVAELKQQEAAFVRFLRGALDAVLAPHPVAKHPERVEALDLLLSFESWERLREQQRLGVARAEQVLVDGALALAGQATPPRRSSSKR